MAPKQQLDKAAWHWAETTDPQNVTREHVETAYRVNLKPCLLGSCRRNCKGNPYCLNGLGEREWLGEIADENWHEFEDPNSERRAEGAFVGLKNLGATCYVNSFLQVWYHNQALRKAIYQWIPELEDENRTLGNDLEKETVEEMPSTVCGHLQLIFASMQFTRRRYIDPSSFIKILGLNTAQQQDAEEFSKLLMSLLEDTLSNQPIPEVRDIIQKQFCGEYSYVTSCNGCFAVSYKPSKFYELDLNIKGHEDLKGCLQEFLEVEKLEGLNQYDCDACKIKQNASRKIELKRLPPVLNLQLLRFVFDRTTGHKKKLNSYIKFPEVLDMSPFLCIPGQEAIYELSAVLIHRGPSAYSGHYIAHIKDRQCGTWFKFNDEETEKMEGKNLQLGCEEDIQSSSSIIPEDSKSTKKPKLSQGVHASKTAYMLVYNKRMAESDPSISNSEKIEIPTKLSRLVDKDNEKFEEWVQEMAEMRDQNVLSGKARQTEIKDLYHLLSTKGADSYEWISCDWLIKWFKDTPSVDTIENSPFLCMHGKLHPDRVTKLKCISVEAANLIYSKHSGGPRLTREFLCEECVVMRCKLIRMKTKIADDNKYISNLLKLKCDSSSGPSYWVGKASLRSWQRLVLEQFDNTVDDDGNIGSENVKNDMSTTDKPECLGDCENNSERTEDELGFNEEILCKHKQLCIEDNHRRLVQKDVWLQLKSYFPNAPEFSSESEQCKMCQLSSAEDQQAKEHYRNMAAEQKLELMDLYLDKNRPIFSHGFPRVYMINQEFLNSWRKFIRDPSKNEPICNVGNSMLICIHDRLIQQVDSDTVSQFSYVWPKEWESICKLFQVDEEIVVNQVEDSGPPPLYITSPVICDQCSTCKVSSENELKLDYNNARLYVRRIANFGKGLMVTPISQECSDLEDQDPEFIQGSHKKKRLRLNDGTDKTALKGDCQIRRSSRHRKTRGEKEIFASSSMTLKDLKLLIMKHFSVAPFDQHLSLNGVDLTENQKTLAELKIAPESLILLKADEPCEDSILMDDYIKASAPEEGFKGTGLQGH